MTILPAATEYWNACLSLRTARRAHDTGAVSMAFHALRGMAMGDDELIGRRANLVIDELGLDGVTAIHAGGGGENG